MADEPWGVPFDIALHSVAPAEIADEARALESAGWGGAFTYDGPHDPLLPVVTAAAHTEWLTLYTNVTVALARNPMTVAIAANDLQEQTGGRFLLGLGSQIKAHIERRFSMPWSQPAARMGEFAAAVRAIQRSWATGEALAFEGEFYRHTLMPPFFNPGPNPFGPPPVILGAVGPRMTEAAGRSADGLVSHPFTSGSFFAEETVPTFERGLAASGRSRGDVSLIPTVIVATAATEEEYERLVEAVRHQLAFYGSTPAYKRVLDHHGWGDLQPKLQGLTREGRWSEMAGLIGDELLETLAICGPIEEIGPRVRERFGATNPDRVAIAASGRPSPETVAALGAALAAT